MTVFVIAAHPDDEVLGCGASIAKWKKAGLEVHILIMSEGVTSRYDLVNSDVKKSQEINLLAKSADLAGNILGVDSVKLLNFPDNRMDSLDQLDLVKVLEEEIERVQPSTVVTHHSGDVNIDHRIIHQAVVTACRPQFDHPVHRILAFQVNSSTEWQTQATNIIFYPNWFEDVSQTIDYKIEALKAYTSELREWPHPRSIQSVEYLARCHGSSIGCDAAEAFMLLREIR